MERKISKGVPGAMYIYIYIMIMIIYIYIYIYNTTIRISCIMNMIMTIISIGAPTGDGVGSSGVAKSQAARLHGSS